MMSLSILADVLKASLTGRDTVFTGVCHDTRALVAGDLYVAIKGEHFDGHSFLAEAIRAGAAGYLLKGTPRADLVRAIEGTAAGQSFVDPQVAGKLLTQVAEMPAGTTARDDLRQNSKMAEALTPRELDVLRLLATGRTNPEIAARLFLSEGTVRNYVSGIFAKLDVADRTQAALIALHHGLVD